jgi:hypothetical protein
MEQVEVEARVEQAEVEASVEGARGAQVEVEQEGAQVEVMTMTLRRTSIMTTALRRRVQWRREASSRSPTC